MKLHLASFLPLLAAAFAVNTAVCQAATLLAGLIDATLLTGAEC